LAENVRIPSYGVRSLQLLKNPSHDILTFPNIADYMYRNGSKISDFETFDTVFPHFHVRIMFFIYYRILFDDFVFSARSLKKYLKYRYCK